MTNLLVGNINSWLHVCVCARWPFLFALIITPVCTHLIWLYSKSQTMLTKFIEVDSVMILI
jgi:hypothetical protein